VTPNSHAIHYNSPENWIGYDATAIVQNFVDAKAAILSLRATPHQRDWVEKMQRLQLKMEVAGTSRIEGAEFTDRELDAALDPDKRAADLVTRSQRRSSRRTARSYRVHKFRAEGDRPTMQSPFWGDQGTHSGSGFSKCDVRSLQSANVAKAASDCDAPDGYPETSPPEP
jgi:hypothetical protein